MQKRLIKSTKSTRLQWQDGEPTAHTIQKTIAASRAMGLSRHQTAGGATWRLQVQVGTIQLRGPRSQTGATCMRQSQRHNIICLVIYLVWQHQSWRTCSRRVEWTLILKETHLRILSRDRLVHSWKHSQYLHSMSSVMDIAVGCYAYGNMFWCM